MRGTAVAGASVIGLASLTGSSAAASYEAYDHIVDVVEAGADDTGTESITPVLEELRADDTASVFPEGRYYMENQLRYTGFDNVGFLEMTRRSFRAITTPSPARRRACSVSVFCTVPAAGSRSRGSTSTRPS
jgi:hypothetical protein